MRRSSGYQSFFTCPVCVVYPMEAVAVRWQPSGVCCQGRPFPSRSQGRNFQAKGNLMILGSSVAGGKVRDVSVFQH